MRIDGSTRKLSLLMSFLCHVHHGQTQGLLWNNRSVVPYEISLMGTQVYALTKWQHQSDAKLFDYAKALFESQTKFGGRGKEKTIEKRGKEG